MKQFVLVFAALYLLISCTRNYKFDYSVIDSGRKHDAMEFPENEIQDARNGKLLKSKRKGGCLYTAYYIFSVAGEGTSRTISPKVYYIKDTAFVSFDFVGQIRTSYDLANLLKLEYIIYDTAIHQIKFMPPSVFDSARKRD